jgi:hypothetical protein
MRVEVMAYSVIDQVGGTADETTFSDAQMCAIELSEDSTRIFAIVTGVNNVETPVGFALNGKYYPADQHSCPKCGGTGEVVSGWDDTVYENMFDNCPLCYGNKTANGAEIVAYIGRSAS